MKIKIVSNVEHDGKTLAVDSTVDLPDEAAEALLKAGAATLPDGKAKAKEAAAAPAQE